MLETCDIIEDSISTNNKRDGIKIIPVGRDLIVNKGDPITKQKNMRKHKI